MDSRSLLESNKRPASSSVCPLLPSSFCRSLQLINRDLPLSKVFRAHMASDQIYVFGQSGLSQKIYLSFLT